MPTAIVLGGINGAGKTTASQRLLAEQLARFPFVNADTIARGLDAYAPESVSIEAGRMMLERLRQLVAARADFAFETTLSGRAYIRFLRDLRTSGYVVELYYFWLGTADLAVDRVRKRVRAGGHDIPEATIRQRYGKSVSNFWSAYRLEADSWYVYDSGEPSPVLLAASHNGDDPLVADPAAWKQFLEDVSDASNH